MLQVPVERDVGLVECAAVANAVNVVGVECVVDGGEVVDAHEGCRVEGCPKVVCLPGSSVMI